MKLSETVIAYGHENIQATHKTTFEITKDAVLSKKGDCIIAASADKALVDLSSEFKKSLCKEKAKLTILVEAGGIMEVISAYGDPRMILTHPTDMVVRKSNHICGRTLAIQATKAANDFSRRLVEKLRSSKQKVKITLVVEV
ncbi:MAG: DUF371 domain-containing protein [Candidatus Bathyarchaeota archaeon]|nr:DUF371 domain-containing protein [Candidatus Bathyarchaeota archaeon]MDH5787439.1 DUF371 domain-containing protein [Candidatus Bathyarchaeota archaeon]